MAQLNAFEVKNLVKSYGDTKALKSVSFEIKKSECFGVLGSKSSGKSTLVKISAGILDFDGGDFYIAGMNARKNKQEIKSRIGTVLSESTLDRELTCAENLAMYAQYFGNSNEESFDRAYKLLREYQLRAYEDRLIIEVGLENQKKVEMIRAKIHDPELIILDEPSAGLSHNHKNWSWDFIKKLKEEKKTILLTTQEMEEAYELCDRVAILNNGKILAIGVPQELILDHIGHEIIEFKSNFSDLSYYIRRLKENLFGFFLSDYTIYVTLDNSLSTKKVMEIIPTSNLQIRKPNLNDVYLKLSGQDVGNTI